jgi:Na+/phosphate symporter
MHNHHHPECRSPHINWGAATVIIMLLCALFGLIGWLWSDRSKVADQLSGNAIQSTSINEKVTALQSANEDFKQKLDIIVPAVARIEQAITDINKRLDTAERERLGMAKAKISTAVSPSKMSTAATADPKN